MTAENLSRLFDTAIEAVALGGRPHFVALPPAPL
jgi:hypothetical protein